MVMVSMQSLFDQHLHSEHVPVAHDNVGNGKAFRSGILQNEISNDGDINGRTIDLGHDGSAHQLQLLKNMTTSDLAKHYQINYTLLPYIASTHWHTKFNHICNYGAGYYTYVYCIVLSSVIWRRCFSDNPLNREMGMKYRNEILCKGGSRHPNNMLRNLLQLQAKNAITTSRYNNSPDNVQSLQAGGIGSNGISNSSDDDVELQELISAAVEHFVADLEQNVGIRTH
jgi:hypothetical protein